MRATQSAICSVCGKRLSLYGESDKLWTHHYLGSRCPGASTHNYRQQSVAPIVISSRYRPLYRSKKHYGYIERSFIGYEHIPMELNERSSDDWKERWALKTGVHPE